MSSPIAYPSGNLICSTIDNLNNLSIVLLHNTFDEKNDFVGAFEIGISVRKIMYSITFFNNIQGVFYETNLDKFITSDSSINPKFLEYLKNTLCSVTTISPMLIFSAVAELVSI